MSKFGGTNSDDLYFGTDERDKIKGKDGDDELHGLAGRDDIKGGDGDDRIYGGADDDKLKGDDGADLLDGGAGEDDLKGGDGNDTMLGGADDDKLDGGKGDDELAGGDGDDQLKGKDGDDILDGGAGNDLLIGGKGEDRLLGGDDADILYGDKGGSGSGFGSGSGSGFGSGSGSGSGGFDDYLDGGAGDDLVFGGGGNDIAVYTMAENTGAQDAYFGGHGIDKLTLNLTRAEWFEPAVQTDIANYLQFLADHTDPVTGEADGAAFQFTAFDLTARQFEELCVLVDGVEIDPADAAVLPVDDAETLDEDAAITAFPSVLLNDDVPDLVHTVTLISGPAEGLLTFNAGSPGSPDGTFSFDPNGEFEDLAENASRDVTFIYEVEDADGDTGQATVTIKVTGRNDGPVITTATGGNEGMVIEAGALDDGTIVPGDPETGGTLTSSDVDTGATATWSGNAIGIYGSFAINPATGEWTYTLDNTNPVTDALKEGQSTTETFTATVTDDQNAIATQDVTVTVDGTNDSPVAVDDVLNGAPSGWLYNPGNGHSYQLVEGGVTFAQAVAGADALGGYLATITTASEQAFIEQNGLVAQSTDATWIGGQTNNPSAGASATWTWVTGPEAGQQFSYENWRPGEPNGGFSSPTQYAQIIRGLNTWNDAPDSLLPGNGQADSYIVEFGGRPEDHGFGEDAVHAIDTALLLANDTDVDTDAVLTVTGVSSVSAGGAAVSLGGTTISYDPRAAFDNLSEGETATDTFTYTVTDEFGAASTATVTLTVQGVNDGPLITTVLGANEGVVVEAGNLDDGAIAPGNQDTGGTLTSSDVDNGATATWGGNAAGIYGTFAIDPVSGEWTYTLDNTLAATDALAENQIETETFTATVTDDFGATATQDVTVTIHGANDSPVAVADVASATESAFEAPPGFVHNAVNGNYYMVNPLPLSQAGASVAAAAMGGHLATITTAQENAFVSSLAGSDWTWLGGSDAASEGSWIWTEGPEAGQQFWQGGPSGFAPGGAYENWNNYSSGANSEPNNSGGEDSLMMWLGGYWNDFVSYAELVSMVEIEGPTPVTGSVAVNDTDVDTGATRTFALDAATAGLTMSSDGSWQFDTTDPAYNHLAAGQTVDVVANYTATDEFGAISQTTLTITVTGSNDGPIAAADVNGADLLVEQGFGVPGDDTAIGNALSNDSDPDVLDVLSVVALTDGVTTVTPTNPGDDLSMSGTYGSILIEANGAWTYTLDNADPDTEVLEDGDTAYDVFTYTVSDGNGGTDTATITLEIAGSTDNTAPVANDDTFALTEDTPATLDLLANDTDANNVPTVTQTLSIASINGVAATVGAVIPTTHGAITISAGGLADYTPDADYNGTDSFTYVTTDGSEPSAAATATLNIAAVNDAPTINFTGAAATFSGATSNRAQIAGFDGFSSPELAVDLFVQRDAISSIDTVLSYASAGGGDNSLLLYLSGNNVGFCVHNISATIPAPMLGDGEFHHLAVTYVGATGAFEIFVDSLSVGGGTLAVLPGGIATGGTLMMGQEQDSIGGALDGSQSLIGGIGNLNIRSQVPTPAEISDAAMGNVDPTGPGIVAALRYDPGSQTFDDASGNGYDLATVGSLPPRPGPGLNSMGVVDVEEDGTVSIGGISVGDIDAAEGTGEVAVTLMVDHGTITLADVIGLSSFVNDGSASVELTGSVAEVNEAISTLIYTPDANYSGPDALDITVDDLGNTGTGGPLSGSTTIAINVTAVNDAPTVIAGNTAAYVENAAGVAVDPGLSLSDEDDTELEGATVAITGAFQSGQDSLNFTDQNGITGSYNAASGILLLTGTATLAQYQAALASVSYSNTSDDPDTTDRTISFTVNDGDLDSAVATSTVTVEAVNDGPSILGATSPGSILANAGTRISYADPGLWGDRNADPLITPTWDSIGIFGGAALSQVIGDFYAGDVLTFDLTGVAQVGFTFQLEDGARQPLDGLAPITLAVGESQIFTHTLTEDKSAIRYLATTSVGGNPGWLVDASVVSGGLDVNEDTAGLFTGLAIADPDVGIGAIDLTLDVADGALALLSTTGLTMTDGDGSDGTLAFSGTLADVNGALTQLQYTGDQDYNGTDFLNIAVNDNGNTGTGGPLSDDRSVVINIAPVNDAPVGVDDTLNATVKSGTIVTYFEDFEGGVTDWTNNTTSTDYTPDPLAFTEVLGRFGSAGQGAIATTIALGAPTMLTISFDFLELYSWDGEAFKVWANGVEVISDSFYVDGVYGNAEGASKTHAVSVSNTLPPFLGESSGQPYPTELWHYEFTFESTTPDLELSFGSTLNQGIGDEAWAIDNLSVTANLPATGTVATNDYDVDGTTRTFGLDAPVAGLTMASDGSYSFDITDPAYAALAEGATTPILANYTVTDEHGAEGHATLTINLTGTNDAPSITSNGGGASASLSIPENTTAVADVDSDDVDDGDTAIYSIIGGADEFLFNIDAATGELAFNSAPDFETPQDVGTDNIYDVTVQVSDGLTSDTQDLAVTVTDVVEVPAGIHDLNDGTIYYSGTNGLVDLFIYDIDVGTTDGANNLIGVTNFEMGTDKLVFQSDGVVTSSSFDHRYSDGLGHENLYGAGFDLLHAVAGHQTFLGFQPNTGDNEFSIYNSATGAVDSIQINDGSSDVAIALGAWGPNTPHYIGGHAVSTIGPAYNAASDDNIERYHGVEVAGVNPLWYDGDVLSG